MFIDGTIILVLKIVMRMLIALAFACSLFLLVTPEGYLKLSRILEKEYGLRKKIIPSIEKEEGVIDNFLLRFRMVIGAIFLFVSIVLLSQF